jgi:putative membrane protein
MSTMTLASSQLLADHYDGPGWWWPLIPILWFTLFVTFFVVAARFGWWGRRRWYDEHRNTDGTRSGTARLAERFAAGEIDEQEYRTRLAVLKETSQRGDER